MSLVIFHVIFPVIFLVIILHILLLISPICYRRYYEMKMTLEEIETHDEITYVNAETGETYTSECRQKRQSVSSEELTSTTQEERKRFLIRGVIDPRTDTEVSFRKAVEDGIIDHRKGLYLNPDTGEGTQGILLFSFILKLSSVFINHFAHLFSKRFST